jgi:superfamily I DNA and/or RNA helicase
MLTTQYRMHPSICALSSGLFYQGKLACAVEVTNRPPLFSSFLPALSFHDVRGEQQARDKSYFNLAEAARTPQHS